MGHKQVILAFKELSSVKEGRVTICIAVIKENHCKKRERKGHTNWLSVSFRVVL